MSVVPFAAPNPGDDTTSRYIAQAQQELQSVNQHIASLTNQRDDLNTKIAADQQRASELTRMIQDLQTP
jgi:septal ring factor EnvC (AmiA/AmiB activator)